MRLCRGEGAGKEAEVEEAVAKLKPQLLRLVIERQDWEAIGRLGLATPEACAATDGEGYAPLHWAQIKGAPPEVWEAIRAAGPEPPPPMPKRPLATPAPRET